MCKVQFFAHAVMISQSPAPSAAQLRPEWAVAWAASRGGQHPPAGRLPQQGAPLQPLPSCWTFMSRPLLPRGGKPLWHTVLCTWGNISLGKVPWGGILVKKGYFIFFFFKVSSLTTLGLELTTPRPRVACSTEWTSQAPQEGAFELMDTARFLNSGIGMPFSVGGSDGSLRRRLLSLVL